MCAAPLFLCSSAACTVWDRKPKGLACTPEAWAYTDCQAITQCIRFQLGRHSLQRGFQISSLYPPVTALGSFGLEQKIYCLRVTAVHLSAPHLEPKVQLPKVQAFSYLPFILLITWTFFFSSSTGEPFQNNGCGCAGCRMLTVWAARSTAILCISGVLELKYQNKNLNIFE